MVNSPLPTDLAGECKKASKILNSFIDPVAAKGPDKVIPPNILQRAKGFAIFTVIKAGFLFSGRCGSGLVVARLENGSWSAPSAINIGGMGVGGQIGAELTDFVIVLNSKDAVKSFMNGGNVTLGGNLSGTYFAAGPVGRTAEGASSVSLGNVAAIFSYSKTKGLFAGVSIEGSIIVERKDTNSKFYHSKVSAKELLSGKIPPPPQADILYRALNAKASRSNSYGETQYNDEPVYGEEYESPKLSRSVSLSTSASKNNSYQNRYSGSTSSTYKDRLDNNKDDSNDDGDDNNSISSSSIKNKSSYSESNAKDVQRALSLSNEFNNRISSNSLNRKSSSKPPPIAPKPNIPPRKKQPTAVALYDFDGEQDGDLTFSKGDVITITKQSESTNDWWTGKCKGKEGIFPANYVELN
nr:14395_t:CDS:10 [Entrophospora candida]